MSKTRSAKIIDQFKSCDVCALQCKSLQLNLYIVEKDESNIDEARLKKKFVRD